MPDLIENWLRTRSVARGLPQPVRDDSGGLRLDTGLPGEVRRYLFTAAGGGLATIAATVEVPFVFLKVSAAAEEVRRQLPPRWQIGAEAFVMVRGRGDPAGRRTALPAGYTHRVETDGNRSSVRIDAPDASPAASGYAAEAHGVFVYDRIVTEPAHRRRGLGRTIMASLGAVRRDHDAPEILVATADGRCLYETIGWTVLSPYTSAVIPG